jgi:hypothetical protein
MNGDGIPEIVLSNNGGIGQLVLDVCLSEWLCLIMLFWSVT